MALEKHMVHIGGSVVEKGDDFLGSPLSLLEPTPGKVGWEGSRVGAARPRGACWLGLVGCEGFGKGRIAVAALPRCSLMSLGQRGESGSGGAPPQSHLSGDSVYVPLFLLQLLPLTPCLLAASLFAAPPHRLPLCTSWGPS